MEALNKAMKNHNIKLSPPSTSSSSYSKGKGHALLATAILVHTSIELEWILDFGASHHMANNESMFTSLDVCNTKKIFFGDSTPLEVKGSGIIELVVKQINDVFCVPYLSTNLLFIYQITHFGEEK